MLAFDDLKGWNFSQQMNHLLQEIQETLFSLPNFQIELEQNFTILSSDVAGYRLVDMYSYLGLFQTVLVLTRSSQLYSTITCLVCVVCN